MKYEYKKYTLQLVREATVDSHICYHVTTPKELYGFLCDICQLHLYAQEAFLIITVNAQQQIIGYSVVSMGDLVSAPVHPREVFKFSIESNARAIILAHNHPSDNPEPSEMDIDTTKRLIEAGTLLGIPVLEHMIVCKDTYISMKEQDLIQFG